MLTIPVVVLVVHFVADFLLQSDYMALNKSKSWLALYLHVAIYALLFNMLWGWQFGLVTFATHFVTDAITSRINARLWEAQQRHWFFVGIGADQLIHYVTLALTWRWLMH